MFERFFKKKRAASRYDCLRCGAFSTTSRRSLESHIAGCEPSSGDGNAAFLDGMTEEEVADIPKAERRRFLGLDFLK